MDFFFFLNKDFLKILLKHLQIKDFFQIIATNQYFHELGKSNEVWRFLLKRDFNAQCMDFDKGLSIKEIYIEEKNFQKKNINPALFSGTKATMKSYLRKGGNVNQSDEKGRTLLYHACWGNQTASVKLLLSRGANVGQAKTYDGWTPLHIACARGNLEIVKLLLEEGTDIDQVNKNGWTPLHEACWAGHTEIVKLLLSECANINAVTNNGMTPLHHARQRGFTKIIELFEKI